MYSNLKICNRRQKQGAMLRNNNYQFEQSRTDTDIVVYFCESIIFVFVCLDWALRRANSISVILRRPANKMEEDPRYPTVRKGSIKHLGRTIDLP